MTCRDEVPALDHRIGKQIEALERGVEPELVNKRIEKLRRNKEAAENELPNLNPGPVDSGPPEDAEKLPFTCLPVRVGRFSRA